MQILSMKCRLIFILFLQTCFSVNLFEVNTDVLESFVRLNQISKKPQCNLLILRLQSWIQLLSDNPLFFENPFSNFKAVKTLALDIPRVCKHKSKIKTGPYEEHVKDSIKMMIELIKTYSVKLDKVFESIPDIDASDCFDFCTQSNLFRYPLAMEGVHAPGGPAFLAHTK